MTSGVYRIVNRRNGKFYIGSSKNIEQRRNKHFRELRQHKHHNINLQNDWDIHGDYNFKFEIITVCENPLECEQKILNSIDWKKSYNIQRGAYGGDSYSNHPDKERLKEILLSNLKSKKI